VYCAVIKEVFTDLPLLDCGSWEKIKMCFIGMGMLLPRCIELRIFLYCYYIFTGFYNSVANKSRRFFSAIYAVISRLQIKCTVAGDKGLQ
jgi:hypothetical protein